MTMILSVLRCPDAVPPQTREVTGGEFSIGRGPDNDWTLPDPDGFLSRRHCVLAYRSGGWQLADVSTNGTFHNRDPDPLGKGAPRDLQDGDRIRMGNYEIEIRIRQEAASGWRDPPPRAAQPQQGAFADPFGDDPFNPPSAPPAVSPGFGADPMLGFSRQAGGSVTLPEDFDPLGADFEAPFTGPTQSDHASALEDRFRPPVPLPAQPGLPADLDDWDLDLTPKPPPASVPGAPPPVAPPPIAPQPAAAPPPPPPEAPPPADPFADLDLTPPAPPPPVVAPVPAPVVAPVASPVAAPAAEPEAFPALPAGDVADPFAEIDVPAVPFAAPPAATPAAPAPTPARPAPPDQAAAIAGDDLLAAFLRGAGMEESRPADPLATMHALGAAFRALVGGLRQALIARATVKGEFRIEQTMIRARGNNPLKFSAGDDDAMAALIGAGRRIDMPPAVAIGEVLRDMRLHELATMSAMQAAVRALLERLDPAPLRAEGERGGGLLPAQKRARAFESFEKLHGEISRALADDFDSVFGKAFARAYEQALHEIADKDTQ